MKYVVDGVIHTKPVVTRTWQQAEIRARGLLGKAACVEALPQKSIDNHARDALVDWLDGLTLLVRNFDVLLSQQEGLEKGYRCMLVRSLLELLNAPLGSFVMAYRVMEAKRLSDYLPPIKTIRGHGWSWDEAFEMLERSLEKDLAEREETP